MRSLETKMDPRLLYNPLDGGKQAHRAKLDTRYATVTSHHESLPVSLCRAACSLSSEACRSVSSIFEFVCRQLWQVASSVGMPSVELRNACHPCGKLITSVVQSYQMASRKRCTGVLFVSRGNMLDHGISIRRPLQAPFLTTCMPCAARLRLRTMQSNKYT
jgi:hypothetical protein